MEMQLIRTYRQALYHSLPSGLEHRKQEKYNGGGLFILMKYSIMLFALLLCLLPKVSFGMNLTVQINGGGTGSVSSSQGGISCPGTCSASLSNGTLVTLSAFPADNTLFSGWGGACAGMEACSLTLTQDTVVMALFTPKSTPYHVSGSFYGALQEGYEDIATGGVVMAVAQNQRGDLTLDRGISYTLAGGYDSAFSSNTGNFTEINGTVSISTGSMTAENIAIGQVVSVPTAAPQNVIAVPGNGQISLTWDIVPGATSYNVYHNTTTGVTRATGTKIAGSTTTPAQTVTDLTNGVTYYFVVTAVSNNGESVESNQVIIAPVAQNPATLAIGVWTMDPTQTYWPGESLTGWTGWMTIQNDGTFAEYNFYNGALDDYQFGTWQLSGNTFSGTPILASKASKIGVSQTLTWAFSNNNNTVTLTGFPNKPTEVDVFNRGGVPFTTAMISGKTYNYSLANGKSGYGTFNSNGIYTAQSGATFNWSINASGQLILIPSLSPSVTITLTITGTTGTAINVIYIQYDSSNSLNDFLTTGSLTVEPSGQPQVYPGCAVPASTPRHIYYSDPTNGSMTNDGSQAHPWGSLSAVVAAGKLPPAATATVTPGDAIYLLSGDHGLLRLDNAFNSDFISIQAAPGQKPTLSGITIYGGSHWAFSGLTIQNLNDGGYVFGVRLDADDVIFTDSTILSQADVSGWTQADWRQYAITGINASGNCVAITNNTIRNVGSAIGISGSNILVHGNSVDYFSDDGIDFGQGTGAGTISNIEISNNTLTNNLDIGDGNHNDGIQGWVLNGTTGSNVLIDSNSVISKTDPSLPWLGNMQGISEFDGAWDGIQITNNVVIAAAYHGISLYGAHNSTIINNTVFGSFVAPNGDVNETWIGVFNAGDGTPPVGVVVRNNISSMYVLANSGVTADHNVTATEPVGMFVTFDRAHFQYNLRPAPGSVELGFGSSQLAPAHDIAGAPRIPPITAGAYQ